MIVHQARRQSAYTPYRLEQPIGSLQMQRPIPIVWPSENGGCDSSSEISIVLRFVPLPVFSPKVRESLAGLDDVKSSHNRFQVAVVT